MITTANKYKQITIFCASSPNTPQLYIDAAYQLGGELAKRGIGCICGAGVSGLMAAVTDGALAEGGHVIGVIPQFMVDNNWKHPNLSEEVITDDMHSRKQYMNNNSDATIALPGGVGTIEELMEIICWRQLGLYHKPIVIVNIGGFFDPLIALFENAISQSLMRKSDAKLWEVANTPEEAIDILLNYNVEDFVTEGDKYK
ncbi:MAG: TIGR00730 family Rossman fold protein [Bacteroidales bacterium]